MNTKCPDCQGLGSFDHWKAGKPLAESRDELKHSNELKQVAQQELVDYMTTGCKQDSPGKQEEVMARLRWARDYWAFRVQTLHGEIGLATTGVCND
jgi:hypothetical protein